MVKEEENKKNGGWVKKPILKSKQEERLDKMLYSLDLNIRKRGRILISEFDKVLSRVSVLQCCSPSQAVLMLKCCGEVLVDEDKQSRTRLLEKTLRLVKNINGMNLDISHYNTLLKVSQHHVQVQVQDNLYSVLLGSSGKRESCQHHGLHGNIGEK